MDDATDTPGPSARGDRAGNVASDVDPSPRTSQLSATTGVATLPSRQLVESVQAIDGLLPSKQWAEAVQAAMLPSGQLADSVRAMQDALLPSKQWAEAMQAVILPSKQLAEAIRAMQDAVAPSKQWAEAMQAAMLPSKQLAESVRALQDALLPSKQWAEAMQTAMLPSKLLVESVRLHGAAEMSAAVAVAVDDVREIATAVSGPGPDEQGSSLDIERVRRNAGTMAGRAAILWVVVYGLSIAAGEVGRENEASLIQFAAALFLAVLVLTTDEPRD